MKLFVVVLLVAGSVLAGCPSGESPVSKDVSTPLSGVVALVRPLAGARVEIIDYRDGKEGQRYADVRTDPQGKWAADMGALYGDYLVRATEGGLERPLTTIVAGVELQEGRKVAVTAVSHLRSAYARHLLSRGAKLEDAQTQASEQIYRHFSNLNHDAVAPWDGGGDKSISDPMRAHLVAAALEHQARRIAKANGLSEAGVTMQSLLWLLEEDVEADGIFDGVGRQGQLTLGGQALTGDTLRADLAVALVRFAESQHNKTGLSPRDVESMAQQLASTRSIIFPHVAMPLHLGKPTVALLAPSSDSVVNGEPAVECTASAAPGLQSITLSASREGASVDSIVLDPVVEMHQGQGTARARLATATIGDGSLTVLCTVEDINGNTESASLSVVVNNIAGSVAVRGVPAPESKRSVLGVVEVSCECSGDEQATSCYLVTPTGVAGFSELRKGVLRWDTAQAAEGWHTLECRAESPGLPTVSDTVPVFVDNRPDGTMCGAVYMETPVEGAQVRAMTLEGEELGYGAAPTTSDGRFCIRVRDTYRGPLLFLVEGADAAFLSGLDGRKMALGNRSLSMVLERYEPNTSAEALSINALTTLAKALGDACLRKAPDSSGAREQCITDAHADLSKHFSRDGLDFRRSRVRDFVSKGPLSSATENEETLLGLVQMGLARLGGEVALRGNYAYDRLPSTELLKRLVLDADNGTFDGLDANGRFISLTESERLRADTLRSDLAGAISRFLNKVPLDTLRLPGAIANHTNLSSLNYSQSGGMLQLMSQNTSPRLFPEDAKPVQFDVDGPVIEFPSCQTLSGEPVDLGLPQRGVIRFTVKASDASGVGRIWLEVDGNMLNGNPGARPGEAVIDLDTKALGLQDGAHPVKIRAADGLGNPNQIEITILVKNKSPLLSLGQSRPWIKEGEHVQFTVDANGDAIKEFEVTGTAGAQSVHKRLTPNTTSFDVDFPIDCDRQVEIRVEAWDWAGNGAKSAPLTVKCDAHPPLVNLEKSRFEQEYSGFNRSYSQAGLYEFTRNGSKPLEFNADGVQTSIPTFEKYAHRMDYIPSRGLDAEKQNLPVINFDVSDRRQSAIGAADEEVKVEYRYVYFPDGNGEGVEKRPWVAVPGTMRTQHTVSIPVSYQTLLPEAASLQAGRADNVVYGSSEADLHRIEVRATDLAGNVSQQNFDFRLKMMLPPILVRGCTFDGSLQGQNASSPAVVAAFSRPGSRVAEAEVVWDFSLPSETLTPELSLPADVSGGELHSSVFTGGWIKQATGGWNSPHAHGRPMYSEVRWSDGRHETFRDGLASPAAGARGLNGSLKAQVVTLDFLPASGPAPTRKGLGGFFLDGRSRYQIVSYLQSPSLDLEGQPYTPRVEYPDGRARLVFKKSTGFEAGTFSTMDGNVTATRPVEQIEWAQNMGLRRQGWKITTNAGKRVVDVQYEGTCGLQETIIFGGSN